VQKCTTTLSSSPVRFTANARATLTRAASIVAHGYVHGAGTRTEFVADKSGTLARGRYVLSYSRTRNGRRRTIHEPITID